MISLSEASCSSYTTRILVFSLAIPQNQRKIGMEGHMLDQFFRVEEGTGEAVLNSVRTVISAGFAVIVPARWITTSSIPVVFQKPPQSISGNHSIKLSMSQRNSLLSKQANSR
jgi:hypothetical protein